MSTGNIHRRLALTWNQAALESRVESRWELTKVFFRNAKTRTRFTILFSASLEHQTSPISPLEYNAPWQRSQPPLSRLRNMLTQYVNVTHTPSLALVSALITTIEKSVRCISVAASRSASRRTVYSSPLRCPFAKPEALVWAEVACRVFIWAPGPIGPGPRPGRATAS